MSLFFLGEHQFHHRVVSGLELPAFKLFPIITTVFLLLLQFFGLLSLFAQPHYYSLLVFQPHSLQGREFRPGLNFKLV